LEALVDRELINALSGKKDALGRLTVTVFQNPLRYVVLCYGVPSRVQGPPAAEAGDEALLRRTFTGNQSGYLNAFTSGQMAKTEASVDGELSLLLLRDMPLRGFYPNPLHRNTTPGTAKDILRVTRIDGPSPDAVLRMLDNALAGEAKGLKGRAYVDEDGRTGAFAMGNDWMAGAAEIFSSLGFDLDHDKQRKTFQATDRFDAPVLYAGWYSGNRNGPFTLPGWRFPEGAVAAHLHSFSAASIRSPDRGWVGPLVERGVSATFGNVAEPYLSLTHHFDAFFSALAIGWNFGDAAYFALPGLSWQGVAVGDPLFRPFATNLDQQVEQIGDPLQILQDQYVVMRQIRLLLNQGKSEEAMALAERGMRDTPGAALALLRAELMMAAGQKEEARRSMAFTTRLNPADSSEWGLYAEIADTLLDLGDAEGAFRIYQNLTSLKMPEKVQLAFLRRGIKPAEKAGEAGTAIEWRARVAPPPAPVESPSKP
jgi:uncharacterized protein (TIGR03790 family)